MKTEAWQAALAAEHEAIFGYELLGPKLTPDQRSLARAAQQAHVDLRNTTSAALSQAGQTPVPPLPDYPALYPVARAGAAIALAIRLESEAATAWRYWYAQLAAQNGSPTLRAQAQAALSASAVRATQWRVVAGARTPTVPFPGI